MPKFEFTHRLFVRVDDVFDISILRVEEGLIIDAYDKDDELLGTLALDEPSREEG
jgi:hypothetical protein